MPPMRQAVANSDAVLPLDRRAGRRPRCGRRRRRARSSRTWPSHSRPMVAASSPATSVPSDGGDLRRPGQQEVAGEDGPEVAPPGVDALDGAAGRGLVHDVVVVERAEVDELDRHAAPDHRRRAPGRSPSRRRAGRRGHGEQRAAAACRRPGSRWLAISVSSGSSARTAASSSCLDPVEVGRASTAARSSGMVACHRRATLAVHGPLRRRAGSRAPVPRRVATRSVGRLARRGRSGRRRRCARTGG